MKRWMQLMMAGAAAAVVACGSDVSGPTTDVSLTKGPGGGTDTTGGGGNQGTGGNQTSNGPVASLTLTPHALTIAVGNYASLVAIARDAAGARVLKTVSWRSADPAIAATISDTGVVRANALGTTKIYATVDGHADSATVTVVPAPPPPPPPTTPTSPSPVAEFNMTVVALGVMPGTDTVHTERVAGARVTLMRRGTVAGDSLSTPVEAGTATTDANGEAKFSRLVGGTYSISIVPPAGSQYQPTSAGIAPPRQSDVTVHVSLRR